MVLLILGLLDVAASITYFFNLKSMIAIFAIFSLLKGGFSLLSSYSTGYIFDWMGVVDLLKGFVLILLSFGISFEFFDYIAWAMFIKGTYTIIRVSLKI